jgi:hypothetical protein
MATANYMDGRVKYKRPQAVIFADNPGTLDTVWTSSGRTATLTSGGTTFVALNGISGMYVGQSFQVTSGAGAFGTNAKITAINQQTLVVTVSVPHATTGSVVFRTGSISYVPEGTEFVNFIVLSDHNRSPIDISTDRIEKRERMVNGRMRSYHVVDKIKFGLSWDMLPSRAFYTTPTFNSSGKPNIEPYTVDGGAGGNDLLKWYEDHVGSFWVYLAYDKYTAIGTDAAAYGHMNQYNQVIEMYTSDFSHNVKTRGSLFDMWDVSISLEEA